jgi:hypothetical protein
LISVVEFFYCGKEMTSGAPAAVEPWSFEAFTISGRATAVQWLESLSHSEFRAWASQAVESDGVGPLAQHSLANERMFRGKFLVAWDQARLQAFGNVDHEQIKTLNEHHQRLLVELGKRSAPRERERKREREIEKRKKKEQNKRTKEQKNKKRRKKQCIRKKEEIPKEYNRRRKRSILRGIH